MTRPSLPRTLVAVALAVATAAGVLAMSSSAASALPNDPLTMTQWKLCTGGDDKRDDSEVAVDILTTGGPMHIVVSPAGETLKNNKCVNKSINLFPLKPSDILGFQLDWTQGTCDWPCGNDQWDFKGLTITGQNTALEGVELLDTSGWSRRFNPDEVFALPKFPSLRGSFLGVLGSAPATPVRVDFGGFGDKAQADVTLLAQMNLNVCGRDTSVPPGTIKLSGKRTAIDPGGVQTFAFSAPFTAGGYTITLKATLKMFPDGHITGSATLTDLPFFWCGSPKLPVLLDPLRG